MKTPVRTVSSLLVAVAAGCAAPEVETSQKLDESKRAATIWNGFTHTWTYNHRLNRLGDWVTLDCGSGPRAERPLRRCEGKTVHTAASGTGADTASFESYHSRVVTDDVGFHSGRARLRVDGREERDLRVEHEGRIPAQGPLRDRDHYAILLNGFDLYSEGRRAKAKKVQRFRLWTQGEADYDHSDHAVEFELGALLNMNCDSVECKQQSNRVRYTVDVRFLVVAFDEAVRKTTKSFQTAYTWNRKRELHKSDIDLSRRTSQIKGVREDYDSAAIAFREIDFDFGKKGRAKDHWFVNWTHAIRNVEYDPASGLARFDLDLFFKEWNRRAKKKLTSIARKGDASLRADLALLQFENARVENHSASGQIEWKGRNRPATSDAAVWKRPFEMSF